MEHLAPESLFYLAAIVSLLLGGATCVILSLGIKHINPYAFLYLIAGICSVGVGERVCHIWLGLNLPMDFSYYPYTFPPQINFVAKTLVPILVLFGALILYCHICFFVLQQKNRKKVNRFYKYAVPISVIITELSVLSLHFLLWYPPYFSMIDQAVFELGEEKRGVVASLQFVFNRSGKLYTDLPVGNGYGRPMKGRDPRSMEVYVKADGNIEANHGCITKEQLKSIIDNQVEQYGPDCPNYFIFSKNLKFRKVRNIIALYEKAGLYRLNILYYRNEDRDSLVKTTFNIDSLVPPEPSSLTSQETQYQRYNIKVKCLPDMVFIVDLVKESKLFKPTGSKYNQTEFKQAMLREGEWDPAIPVILFVDDNITVAEIVGIFEILNEACFSDIIIIPN